MTPLKPQTRIATSAMALLLLPAVLPAQDRQPPLINDIPRTASVRAVTPLEAFALGHDDFVEAVSGHAVSQATARDLVDEHLTADQARDA